MVRLLDSIFEPEVIRAGLAGIALALLLGVLHAVGAPARLRRVAGGLVALAPVLALGTEEVPRTLLAVLAVGALAGAALDLLPPMPIMVPIGGLAGGALVLAAMRTDPVDGWVQAAAVVTGVLGGAALVHLANVEGDTSLATLLATSALAGTYLAVPETSRALPMLAIGFPLALAAYPFRFPPGLAAALPLLAGQAWVVSRDGLTRESAVIGSFACYGLAVLAMLLALVPGRDPVRAVLDRAGPYRGIFVAACAQGVWVLAASRVVGRPGPTTSVVLLAGLVVVAVALLLVIRPVALRHP